MKLKLITVLLFFISVLTSCKKDINTESLEVEKSEALIKKFFSTEKVLDPDILGIIKKLELEQKKYEFVEKVITMAGYPKWDKTVKVKTNLNGTNLINDSTSFNFIIPTIGFTNGIVTGAILIQLNNPNPYHLVLLSDFTQHGLQKEQFIREMMALNYKALGNNKYKVLNNSITNINEVVFKPSTNAQNSFSSSNLGNDCYVTEIWYNPNGDACNCDGDEYDTGVREYSGTCPQQTTSVILPSGGGGGSGLPPYYYPLIGLPGGGGGNPIPSNTPYIPISNFTPAHFLLTGQLNLILGTGDTYYFTAAGGDPNQSLSFNTVGEFQNFLNDNNANQTFDLSSPVTIINQVEKIVHAKINLTYVAGVDVSCKLYKSGNLWQVTNISSTEYGFAFSWTWEQSNYATSALGNEITVNVEGFIKYNVFLQGLGTVYKQSQKYIIKINIETGLITSITKG